VLVSATPGTGPHGIRVLEDQAGRFAERFDAREGTAYLIRPDQHVAARWRAVDAAQVQAALARATCNLA
jgi:3-(3-hydroxy-phenyl)propionate hydroxylase